MIFSPGFPDCCLDIFSGITGIENPGPKPYTTETILKTIPAGSRSYLRGPLQEDDAGVDPTRLPHGIGRHLGGDRSLGGDQDPGGDALHRQDPAGDWCREGNTRCVRQGMWHPGSIPGLIMCTKFHSKRHKSRNLGCTKYTL